MAHYGDAVIETDSNRIIAADAACTIDAKARCIILLGSTTGTKAISVPAVPDGCRVKLILKAASGGAYTIAATNISTAGTVTLDAAAESVELAREGGVWNVVELTGATFA